MIKGHTAILMTQSYLSLDVVFKNLFIFSKEDEIDLINVTSQYCNTNEVWLAITDQQQEGNFLDISKSSYEALYHQESLVGDPLKEQRWNENEPNGGTIENCVAKGIKQENPDKSWIDYTCDAKLCVTCSVVANKLFQLRGLCQNTL